MHAVVARVAPRVARLAPRALHTSAALPLPRVRGGIAREPQSAPHPRQAYASESVVPVTESIDTEALPASHAEKEQTSGAPSLPWFMQEEVVDEPEPEITGAPIAWVPSYLPATTDIPDAVATLFDMLISGSLSSIVARPREPEGDQWGDVIRSSPIAVIRPIPLGDGDMMSSIGWIIVVETRHSSPGAVRRVASEIGKYLQHTRAPSAEPPMSLDDLLGAPVYYGTETRVEPKKEKEALKTQFPDVWSRKSISNEAHVGIKLLHETDPERFSVSVIARRFGLQADHVRKLLKSRPRMTTEAATRTNRRARLLESMRRNAQRDGELEEVESLRAARVPNTPQLDMSINNPVRYEGLVSAADLNKPRQKGVASRGSGDWCLVDAEWCMVHVMTAEARARYRIEEMWRGNGA
ncbi:asparagine--tRNA ligase [Malassezia cuniculi]|uniref:Asparagine--tRNA ligase n=1 Tax=Malassezia cuniculi TaxID=948313 RepID=A0AAF0ETT4_9BASI|nr:asparagine--tRNA ligase [Malassezia cuniculi]